MVSISLSTGRKVYSCLSVTIAIWLALLNTLLLTEERFNCGRDRVTVFTETGLILSSNTEFIITIFQILDCKTKTINYINK